MKKFYLIVIFLITAAGYQQAQENKTEGIRPISDSIGFCWDKSEMDTLMKYLSGHNQNIDTPENLAAAISVHDDYLYAGNVYYPLYHKIHTKEVVIFGVTHATVRKELGNLSNLLILDEYSSWYGPYGNVKISPLREKLRAELPQDSYIISNTAHRIEHSIEALIPFLQYYNRDIKITPIMVTMMSPENLDSLSNRLAEIISAYIKSNNLHIGKDIFFLISNDANHYGKDFNNSPYGMNADAHSIATANDKRIINEDLEGRLTEEKIKMTANDILPDSTRQDIPLWCGRYPIVFGLTTILRVIKSAAKGSELTGRLFRYSDSFTEKVIPVKNTGMGVTAVFSYQHWCGWFTEGFYLQPEP